MSQYGSKTGISKFLLAVIVVAVVAMAIGYFATHIPAAPVETNTGSSTGTGGGSSGNNANNVVAVTGTVTPTPVSEQGKECALYNNRGDCLKYKDTEIIPAETASAPSPQQGINQLKSEWSTTKSSEGGAPILDTPDGPYGAIYNDGNIVINAQFNDAPSLALVLNIKNIGNEERKFTVVLKDIGKPGWALPENGYSVSVDLSPSASKDINIGLSIPLRKFSIGVQYT